MHFIVILLVYRYGTGSNSTMIVNIMEVNLTKISKMVINRFPTCYTF